MRPRDYSRLHDEQDRLYGRPLSEIRGERDAEWIREKCAGGQVFQPMERAMTTEATATAEMETQKRKVREFAENYTALAKDAAAVMSFLEKNAGEAVFVRIDDKLYTLSKNYGASYEFPVTVRLANVIEA